jgi:hypothetical protein
MIVDELIQQLESFGYPVFRQGSLGEEEPYPSTFITFWENPARPGSYYDNEDANMVYSFYINVYSDDPDKTYGVLADIVSLLKSTGWGVPDRGHDVVSDEVTHTGRGIQAVLLICNLSTDNP